mmetsp:Transcript_117933/g.333563  ORF Transcript_117933/g.333563 Transcript_117933/m.333563 type:complete len:319 (+) Transcript_117933:79-1035(+)
MLIAKEPGTANAAHHGVASACPSICRPHDPASRTRSLSRRHFRARNAAVPAAPPQEARGRYVRPGLLRGRRPPPQHAPVCGDAGSKPAGPAADATATLAGAANVRAADRPAGGQYLVTLTSFPFDGDHADLLYDDDDAISVASGDWDELEQEAGRAFVSETFDVMCGSMFQELVKGQARSLSPSVLYKAELARAPSMQSTQTIAPPPRPPLTCRASHAPGARGRATVTRNSSVDWAQPREAFGQCPLPAGTPMNVARAMRAQSCKGLRPGLDPMASTFPSTPQRPLASPRVFPASPRRTAPYTPRCNGFRAVASPRPE